MKGDYLAIRIRLSPDQHDLVIAGLYDLGFEAFVEEESSLQAFIREDQWTVDKKKETESYLVLEGLGFSEERFEDQDWNAQWESNFEDILLRGKLQIRAVFHPQNPSASEELIIAPKMAFGTGHHATTRLILEWMCDQNFTGQNVLDFGCGTGILGIYAKLKGAATICGIDIEEASMDNAKENASLNGVHWDALRLGSIEQVQEVSYDLILANITRNILTEFLPDLWTHLAPGGRMLISGFLESDLEHMTRECEKLKAKIVNVLQEQDWISMVLERT